MGRRTFAEGGVETSTFEIEWFERKAKKKTSWGRRPAFRLTCVGYTPHRRPIPQVSSEKLADGESDGDEDSDGNHGNLL